MRNLQYYLLIIVFCHLGINKSLCNNQTKIDSLENILKDTKEEKSIPVLGELSKAYLSVDLNRSLNYAGKALEVSEKYHDEQLVATSNLYIADIYFEMSRFQSAIEFYEKALDYFYEQRSSENKIYIYNKLGHSEKLLSNHSNALFYYQKPLNLYLAAYVNKAASYREDSFRKWRWFFNS